MNKSLINKRLQILCVIFLTLLLVPNLLAQTQDDGEQTRQIIPVFENARRKSSKSNRKANYSIKKTIKPRARIAQNSNSGLAQAIAKRRFSTNSKTIKSDSSKQIKKEEDNFSLAQAEKIGLTLWKMENSANTRSLYLKKSSQTKTSSDSRDLVHPINGLTPVRVSAETLFRAGDKIRLSIESPTDGYLYVLNCEVYDDDSRGKLSLIFPTTRTRGGKNFLTAGSPIEFPAATDQPSYFEFRPRQDRKAIAEALVFMVTKTPIENFTPQDEPLVVDYERFEKWEKKWTGKVQIWETKSELGKGYTQAEYESASETRTRGLESDGRSLKPEEPEPQTLFAIQPASDDGVVFTLLLRYL